MILSCVALAIACSFPSSARAQMTLLHYDSTAYAIKSGTGSRAIVFLAGLGAGSYVYDREIARLAPNFVTYAVDFAGLDGEPAVPPPFLDRYEQSIVHLVRDQKLTGAILVGDHFGGQVALRVAADLPDRIAGVVAIDSLTCPSPIPAAASTVSFPSVAEMRAMTGYTKLPKDQFAAEMKTLAKTLVTAAGDVATVERHLGENDPATIGGVLDEYAEADVRSRLPAISARVELIASYTPAIPAATWIRVYTPFYAGTPHFSIEPLGPSKHLVMYDQAHAFGAALDRFIAAVEGRKT